MWDKFGVTKIKVNIRRPTGPRRRLGFFGFSSSYQMLEKQNTHD